LASPAIKNLSVAQLLTLREDIDKLLKSKRSELEMQLKLIAGEPSVRFKRPVVRAKRPEMKKRSKGGKVVAKYRHPRTGETWSGRGVTAAWLANEIKAGRTKEDFLISGSTSKRTNGKRD
jgi:DNA-binding protein H-NS